uniref:Ig-like domain-containing protein n=1 Tax=Neogobius melanostomus TaxID=47308 RepID=A0A8C6UTU4_9GOBI
MVLAKITQLNNNKTTFLLTLVAEETLIYAQAGEDVSLNLQSESERYFQWYFDNTQIAWYNPLGGHKTTEEWRNRLIPSHASLLIKNLTQTDFSVFSCTVKYKQKEVVAVEPPVLLPGDQLSLTCEVKSKDYTPQFHWVDPRGQKMVGGGTLTVQATSLHSGQWTCVVTRAGKEKNVTMKVTVIDLLPPAPIPTEYTSLSRPFTVRCSLAANTTWAQVKSKGIPEVGWSFCPAKPPCDKSSLFRLSLEDAKPTWKTLTDRALRPRENPSRGDLSLGRNLAREEDAGDYECFMKFQDGVILNRTVRVEVLRIIASPGTQLTTGQQLNLTCITDYPLPPDMQIQWFPPEVASSSSSSSSPSPSAQDLHSPHLTLKEVGSDQNGTWRCELRRGDTFLTSAVVVLNIGEWGVLCKIDFFKLYIMLLCHSLIKHMPGALPWLIHIFLSNQ